MINLGLGLNQDYRLLYQKQEPISVDMFHIGKA